MAIVPGERTNLKITFPEDFVLAASLLESTDTHRTGHEAKSKDVRKKARKRAVKPKGCFVTGLGSVSYTHLDVYKRQVSSLSQSVARISSETRISLAVSSILRSPLDSPFSLSLAVRFLTTPATSKISPLLIFSRLLLSLIHI